jgi:hypothetical protein
VASASCTWVIPAAKGLSVSVCPLPDTATIVIKTFLVMRYLLTLLNAVLLIKDITYK